MAQETHLKPKLDDLGIRKRLGLSSCPTAESHWCFLPSTSAARTKDIY